MSYAVFVIAMVSVMASLQFIGKPDKCKLFAMLIFGFTIGTWVKTAVVQPRLDKLKVFEDELAERVQERWGKSE